MWGLAAIHMSCLEWLRIRCWSGTWETISRWGLRGPGWGMRLFRLVRIILVVAAGWEWFTYIRTLKAILTSSLFTSRSPTWRQLLANSPPIKIKASYVLCPNGRTTPLVSLKSTLADVSATGPPLKQRFSSEVFQPFLARVTCSRWGPVMVSWMFLIFKVYQRFENMQKAN